MIDLTDEQRAIRDEVRAFARRSWRRWRPRSTSKTFIRLRWSSRSLASACSVWSSQRSGDRGWTVSVTAIPSAPPSPAKRSPGPPPPSATSSRRSASPPSPWTGSAATPSSGSAAAPARRLHDRLCRDRAGRRIGPRLAGDQRAPRRRLLRARRRQVAHHLRPYRRRLYGSLHPRSLAGHTRHGRADGRARPARG